MGNLLANFADYESQLLKLELVEFAAGTFGTGAAGNINIYQNSEQMVCRNHFGTFTGYVTDPDSRFNVTGFAIPNNASRQIAPRDENDIQEVQYDITLISSPGGAGTLTGGGLHSYNASVTINATPTAAYNFINWTENSAEVTTNQQYTFNALEDRTFTANFQMKTYTIAASVSGGNGTIEPSGTATVNHGTNHTYTFTPDFGYEIDQVLINGTNNPTAVAAGSHTFTNVTADQTIVVSFKLKTYTLTLDPSTGTVSPTTLSVTYTQPIGTIPTPVQANCIFTGWFIDGTLITSATVWNYTSNQTAIAIWEYPIDVIVHNPLLGTVTPAGDRNIYLLNETQMYTFAPNFGAHITSVVIDGVTLFEGNPEVTQSFTHTFTNINDYHYIVVGFAQNCYAINPGNIVGTGATLTMTPSGCIPHGSPVTFNISVDCYAITQVLIDGVPQGPITTYHIPAVIGKLPLINVQTSILKYTITATPAEGVDPLGYVIPAGDNIVDCDGEIMFEFFTEFGYRIKTLYVDDVSVPVPASRRYTFYDVRDNHTIHAEFEEFPQYIIQFGPGATQNAGGIVFSVDMPNVEYFVAVDSGPVAFTFSSVPATGFEIDQVFIDDIPNAMAAAMGSYTFTDINAHHSIYATFKLKMFTITATAGANGIITPNGNVSVDYGTNEIFQAIPNTGYVVSAIYVDGALVTANNGVYEFVNVQANHTIHAEFTKETYLITAIAGANGSIIPGDAYVQYGDNITFTFIPNVCYKIDKVWIDGVQNLAAAQNGFYTFTNVSQPHQIEVTFTKLVFTIVATHTLGGVLTPVGTISVECGDHSPIYVFIPDEGYCIQSVIVDGVNDPDAVESAMYRFLGVTANHTLHVIFTPCNFTITASATTGGVINPSGIVHVPTGTDRTFTFAAETGFELVRVMVDGIDDPMAVQTGTHTFTNVLSNHTIAAQFERKQYNIYLPNVTGAMVIPQPGYITTVEHGSTFAFTVELAEGYMQSNITVRVNNIVIGNIAGIYTINNIVTDQTITVEGVELNKYRLIARAHAGGTITPSGTFMVAHGDYELFNVTANANYKIKELLVNGTAVELQGSSYLLENINANTTVEAYFTYNIGINENDEATISVFGYNNVITIVNESLVLIKSVEIMDMNGRVVWTGSATGEKTEITLHVATGIYGVRMVTNDNQQITTKVSIKQ
jgi:hypothetical protein